LTQEAGRNISVQSREDKRAREPDVTVRIRWLAGGQLGEVGPTEKGAAALASTCNTGQQGAGAEKVESLCTQSVGSKGRRYSCSKKEVKIRSEVVNDRLVYQKNH